MTLRLGSPDRRAILRGTSPDEPRRAEVVQRIVGTYAEMPALTLEIDDAARLFGFRIRTCEAVMNDLVRRGVLRRAAGGQYVSAR